jgi:photosystem II stability/assembly factor-like uncharacterized protein
LIATRKGAFTLKGDRARREWTLSKPMMLGHTVHHWLLDPRDKKTSLMACRTGHLGPTVFRSLDFGKTWKEAERPPAFPKAPEGEKGRIVDHVFWLTPGHAEEPDVWYAGTSPHGLFRSNDGGQTWDPVAGFNDNPMRSKWSGPDDQGPPDGATTHSILVDPRDRAHLYLGLSVGGVFESRDRGETWAPLNKGCRADFIPVPDPEYGHDPHCLRLHPLNPDRLYQQNHCGIYRMQRDENEPKWIRIGENMPDKVGDIGFPLVLHPRDPDTCWVFPMDGSQVWPRVSVGGKPAAYVTTSAGKRWTRQDKGFPKRDAWWTVKRQAMSADARDPVGLYIGTTSGEIWGSRNEGASWSCLAQHLPEIYAVEAIERP